MGRRLLGIAIVLAGGISRGAETPEPRSPGDRPDPSSVARRLDELLAKEVLGAGAKLAPRCDDATFLRRAWLDVVGDVPTPEHVTAFLLDPGEDKRSRVVAELLADPQYGLNWARYWRDVIFSRRVEDRALLAANALEADLSDQFNRGVGWDQIAEGFVTASGDVRENGATAIIMAQDGRTEETTAEMARILIGVQIQCAQCHDHPYDSWKREQFHELAAFFPRIGVRPVVSSTKRSFRVVSSDRPFAPRMGNNAERQPEPEHIMPDLVHPDGPGTRMQPRFFLTGSEVPLGATDADRRGTLARWLTENPWFATAAVNRIWAELVGEGFYEPIDDLGPERKPSVPEAVELLAESFRASGYDMKWLIATIAATDAYQRESRPRRDSQSPPFAANVPQPLRSDQLYNAVLSALDVAEAEEGPLRRGGGQRGGRRQQFDQTFGYDPSEPRDSIGGSIPQSLALMNSPQIAGALRAGPRTMLGGLLKEIPENRPLITELYLRIVSRPPTAKELARASDYFDGAKSRQAAVEDLAWALVNSAEFRYRR
jgi:hypothetical protein